MVTIVQSVWLEESEQSIRDRQHTEAENYRLAMSVEIPPPVLFMHSKSIYLDLSLVVSIETEGIILNGKEYTLPVVSMLNSEAYILNEDINELNKLILAAKGRQEQPQIVNAKKPIDTSLKS